jgi:hypothetical protein
VTPPTARKRAAAAQTAAAQTAAAQTAAAQTAAPPADADGHRFVGANRMAEQPGQRVVPAGLTHVVDGWQPVCGEPRVKFVFPGATLDDAAEVCEACAGRGAVRRVPRQRRASTA